jgi:hypothetical protein
MSAAGSELVAYRHAAYDTPFWVSGSRRPGRFHHAVGQATQYLCLHPLGPAAEMLRHHLGPAGAGDADTVLLNLWAARVRPEPLVTVRFDNCAEWSITPEELVADDYRATQALAGRVQQAGVGALVVPSAALPFTENLVLFGPRVLHPYLAEPLGVEECPAGHLSDGARPPAELAASTRWIGQRHDGLGHWQRTGEYRLLDDPPASRW